MVPLGIDRILAHGSTSTRVLLGRSAGGDGCRVASEHGHGFKAKNHLYQKDC